MPSITGAPSGPSPTPSGSNSATYSDNGMVYSPQSREGARSPSSPRHSSHEQAFNASPPMGQMMTKARPAPQHAIAESNQNYSEPPIRARENNHSYNDRQEPIDEREKWRREKERQKESYRESPDPKYPSSRYPGKDDERVVQRSISPVASTVTVQQSPAARNGPPSPMKSKERERQERHDRAREREELREKSRKEKELREEKGKLAINVLKVLSSCSNLAIDRKTKAFSRNARENGGADVPNECRRDVDRL